MTGSATNPLTSQEFSRVVALSFSIAGGVVFLYFLDLFLWGNFDPSYLSFWPFVVMDRRAPTYWWHAPPVLWSLWAGLWFLCGLAALRNRGSRFVAFACFGAFIGGIVVYEVIFYMIRVTAMRGIGTSP